MKRITQHRRLAALALAFTLALPGLDAAAACLSAAESRQAVDSGRAAPLSQALSRAGIGGKPVSVALCEAGSGYVYEVTVRDANGNLRTVTIPAG